MPRLVLACLLLLGTALPPAVATAEELSFEAIELARESYQQGSDAFRQGRYAEAEQDFQRVYQVLRSPNLLSDIGLAQERQGHWADAATSLEAYLREAPRVKNRGHIEARIAELHQRAERQAEIRKAEQGTPGDPGNEMLRFDDPEDRLLGLDDGGGAAVEPEKKGTRWWVWALVGGGVAAAAVGTGVGVGLALRHSGPAATDFPDIGPGSTSSALLRF